MSNEFEILYRNYDDKVFNCETPKTFDEAMRRVSKLVGQYDMVELKYRK